MHTLRSLTNTSPKRKRVHPSHEIFQTIMHSLVLWACIFLALTGNANAQNQSLETTQSLAMIRGLQERRLFDLAEQYAMNQIRSESVPQIEKVDVLTRLLQCKVVQAASLTGTARADAWSRAHAAAQEFLIENPDHPRKLLLQIQDALTHYSQGNLISQEIAAEIQPATEKPKALNQFRSANKILKPVGKEIEKLLPVARSRSQSGGELNEQQLINLQNNVKFQIARINLARAETYDADQELSQIDALQQVLQQLDELTSQTNSDVPLWWRAQTSRIKCLRLMKRFDQATRVINDLPETELTDDLKTGILAQRVLIAAETGQDASRQELFDEIAAITRPGPQLSLAVLRWMMGSAARANGATKQQLQQQAADWVAAIENAHGAYWGRRAEILLVGSIKPDSGSTTVAEGDFRILVRQADNAFRKKNYPDAARAYAKAAQFAQQKSNAKDAIYLNVRQAQCFENVKDHAAAASTLISIASEFPSQPNSADVHLRGCWNFAKTLPNNSERKVEFAELLTNQSASWPNAESSNQARIWLGDHFQNEKQWEQAIAAYLSVAKESSKSLTAAEQITGAVERWYRQSPTDRKQIARQVAKLVDGRLRFASIEAWNEPARLLLIEWVDAKLYSDSIDLDSTKLLLQTAAAEIPDEQVKWIHDKSMRQIILSMKGKVSESELEQQVRELPSESKRLIELARLMDACLTQQQQGAYAKLTLLICDKALSDSRSADDLSYWHVKRATSALASGRAEEVLTDLESLASQNPKSLEIQLAYSRVLSQIPDRAETAMKQWRKLATKVKQGTDAWYESKFNVVKLMVADGKLEEARKLVEYLKATSPSWSKSVWSKKMEQLGEKR